MADGRLPPIGEGETEPKHDAWVVPYADMLTLLFAMFVVFYAVGRAENEQLMLQRLSRGFMMGLPVSGPGDGLGDQTLGEGVTGKGELLDGLEMINQQSGGLLRFLENHLPETFLEIAGHSLRIDLSSDTVAFSTDLAGFFEPGEAAVQAEVREWLVGLFESDTFDQAVWQHAGHVRVEIEAPYELVGRNRNGVVERTNALCHARLLAMESFLDRLPQVEPAAVSTSLRRMPPSVEHWETAGRITIAFSNE